MQNQAARCGARCKLALSLATTRAHRACEQRVGGDQKPLLRALREPRTADLALQALTLIADV